MSTTTTTPKVGRNDKFFEDLLEGATKTFVPKKTKTPHVEWVTLTPPEAKHILKYYNKNNRKPSKTTVLKYAKDMEAGNWRTTAETISFDVNGNAINCQHRLYAMIAADVSIKYLIAYGLDPKIFDVLDQGNIRTSPTILGLKGYEDSINLNALARAIIAYEYNGDYDAKNFKGVNQITTSEIIDYLNNNKGVIDYLDKYKSSPVVTNSVSSFCYWLLSETNNKKDAEKYLDMVFLGLDLKANSIEHYVFSKLQRNKNATQNKMTKTAIIANVILGWRRYMGWSQSKAMQITWDSRKSLPSPIK